MVPEEKLEVHRFWGWVLSGGSVRNRLLLVAVYCNRDSLFWKANKDDRCVLYRAVHFLLELYSTLKCVMIFFKSTFLMSEFQKNPHQWDVNLFLELMDIFRHFRKRGITALGCFAKACADMWWNSSFRAIARLAQRLDPLPNSSSRQDLDSFPFTFFHWAIISHYVVGKSFWWQVEGLC